MKKITLLFCFIAEIAIGQTKQQVLDKINADIYTNSTHNIKGDTLNHVLKQMVNLSGPGLSIPVDTVAHNNPEGWDGWCRNHYSVYYTVGNSLNNSNSSLSLTQGYSRLETSSNVSASNSGAYIDTTGTMLWSVSATQESDLFVSPDQSYIYSSNISFDTGINAIYLNGSDRDSVLSMYSGKPIVSTIQSTPLPIIPIKHITDSIYTIVGSDAGNLLILDTASICRCYPTTILLPFFSDVPVIVGTQYKFLNLIGYSTQAFFSQQTGQTFYINGQQVYSSGCVYDQADLSSYNSGIVTNIGKNKWSFQGFTCD